MTSKARVRKLQMAITDLNNLACIGFEYEIVNEPDLTDEEWI